MPEDAPDLGSKNHSASAGRRWDDWNSAAGYSGKETNSASSRLDAPIYDVDVYRRLEAVRNVFNNVYMSAFVFAAISLLTTAVHGIILYRFRPMPPVTQLFTVASAFFFLFLAAATAWIGWEASRLKMRSLNSGLALMVFVGVVMIGLNLVMAFTPLFRWFALPVESQIISLLFLVLVLVYLHRNRKLIKKTYAGLIAERRFASVEEIKEALRRVLYPDKLVNARLNIFRIDKGTLADELETRVLAQYESRGLLPQGASVRLKNEKFRESVRHYLRYSVFLGINLVVIAYILIMSYFFVSRSYGWAGIRNTFLVLYAAAAAFVFIFRRRIDFMYAALAAVNLVTLVSVFPLVGSSPDYIFAPKMLIFATVVFAFPVMPLVGLSLVDFHRHLKARRLFRKLGLKYDYATLDALRMMYSMLAGFLIYVENTEEDGW